jgi:hypothetical protein
MDQGKEFVKIYNKKIELILNNFSNTFEDNYNNNFSFKKIEKIIVNQFECDIKTLEKNYLLGEIIQNTIEYYRGSVNLYENEIAISLINNEIKKNVFDEKQKDLEIDSYSEFICLLAKIMTYRDFFRLYYENRHHVANGYEKKDIRTTFKLIKAKNEIHTLKIIPIVKKDPNLKKELITNLTINEKMIILHVLIHHYVDNTKRIPSTIYFRVLSLCCSGLEDLDFYAANTNKTKYNYFSLGVNASTKKFKGDKKNMIDSIISKISMLENIDKFIDALNRYKNTKI